MFIIILGKPGSGKGTIAKEIAEDMNLIHISMGDIVREKIHYNERYGRKLNKKISKGKLLSDNIIIDMLKNTLKEVNPKNGIILDGYPRTIKQAISLEKILNIKVDLIINIDISDENIIKRIVNRRICSNRECTEIYNLEYKIPKVQDVCDKCGAKLFKRDDDNEKAIGTRLKIYEKMMKPIVKFYSNKKLLYTINAKLNSSEEEIKKLEKYIKEELY